MQIGADVRDEVQNQNLWYPVLSACSDGLVNVDDINDYMCTGELLDLDLRYRLSQILPKGFESKKGFWGSEAIELGVQKVEFLVDKRDKLNCSSALFRL